MICISNKVSSSPPFLYDKIVRYWCSFHIYIIFLVQWIIQWYAEVIKCGHSLFFSWWNLINIHAMYTQSISWFKVLRVPAPIDLTKVTRKIVTHDQFIFFFNGRFTDITYRTEIISICSHVYSDYYSNNKIWWLSMSIQYKLSLFSSHDEHHSSGPRPVSQFFSFYLIRTSNIKFSVRGLHSSYKVIEYIVLQRYVARIVQSLYCSSLRSLY